MKNHRKILFLAPLPPPIDGQSKASFEVLHALQNAGWFLEVIHTNRIQIERNIASELVRIFDVFVILWRLIFLQKEAEFVYISLSESNLGNLKDLLTYLLLLRKLDRTVIHMLGGSGMNRILKSSGVISWLNKYFMKKMKFVIVEGERGRDIFSEVFNLDDIKIVPNFVEKYLHVRDQDVERKFKHLKVINLLYLSNLLEGKGYIELLMAYRSLSVEVRRKISLKFVGGFSNHNSKQNFMSLLETVDGAEYLGKFVDGEKKKELFSKSHVFCLPTYYQFEGQPISILEAYASGCVVVTTPHGGIPDIFKDGKNGYYVKPKDITSLCLKLQYIVSNKGRLRNIALNNAREALHTYNLESYHKAIVGLFE
jgi:glycosyltransferase involved in cell wall biosynthesis